ASTSRSSGSPRAICRSSMSIRSAARMSWYSTVPRSACMATARSPSSFRRFANRSRQCGSSAPATAGAASLVANALGVRYDVVAIEHAVAGLEKTLAPVFAGRPRDVTEENLQARARGTVLMAISNKFGLMVVTTGNKSEMSVGYATLYGDMNGGFNPIKDLYKTEVYRLARLRNAWRPDGGLGALGPVIRENIITRAPTAELRENQTD